VAINGLSPRDGVGILLFAPLDLDQREQEPRGAC
jgi:hypothetical protein